MVKPTLLACLIVLVLVLQTRPDQSQKMPNTQLGSSWTTVTKGS